jgi:hypothetical protein
MKNRKYVEFLGKASAVRYTENSVNITLAFLK